MFERHCHSFCFFYKNYKTLCKLDLNVCVTWALWIHLNHGGQFLWIENFSKVYGQL